jgi:hypothetical protein
MGQIDYFLRFASRAAAKADAVAVLETALDEQGTRQWLHSHCVEVAVWRDSQDVDGVHTYLTGFFVLISLNRVVAALRDHSAVQLVVDRDKMNARQPGFVLAAGVSNAILQDIRISPIFAGMNPPWGEMN